MNTPDTNTNEAQEPASAGCMARLVRRCQVWNETQGTCHTPETYDEERTRYPSMVMWDLGWEQCADEQKEIRQYAEHALKILQSMDYDSSEDGKADMTACVDLDWFFHVRWGLERILNSPPNAERTHGGAGQPNQPETPTPLDGASCSPSYES